MTRENKTHSESLNQPEKNSDSATSYLLEKGEKVGTYRDTEGRIWVRMNFLLQQYKKGEAGKPLISQSTLESILSECTFLSPGQAVVVKKSPYSDFIEKQVTKSNLYLFEEAIQKIDAFLIQPRVDKESGIYSTQDGKTYAPGIFFRKEWGIPTSALPNLLSQVESIPGKAIDGKQAQLYDIEAMQVLCMREGRLPEGFDPFVAIEHKKREKEKKRIDAKEAGLPDVRIESPRKIFIGADRIPWALREYFIFHYNIDPQNDLDLQTAQDTELTKEALVTIRSSGIQEKRILFHVANTLKTLDAVTRREEDLIIPNIDGLYTDRHGIQYGSQRYILQFFSITRSVFDQFKNVVFSVSGLVQGRPTRLYAVEEFREIISLFAEENYKNEKRQNAGHNLVDFVKEVLEGKTERGREFRQILQAFGAKEAMGILFRIHPEFKDLPIEFVQSVLADYLGDTLATPPPTRADLFGEWKPRREYFSTPDARSAFYETVKASCLKYYYEEKRRGNYRESKEIIYQYLDHLLEQIEKHHVNIPELDDILQDVTAYYESIFVDIEIPEHIVEQLGEEREFPDVNQRINIRELQNKKRIVIGDEMGLGKSASSILAKEFLGARCALIVAPDNVLSTWQRYLSDDRDRGGYFKTGEEPRVRIIETPQDLEQIEAESYDYVLISQEKLTDRYTSVLVAAGFDMIIVDEIHKLKNLEGVRHKGLMQLSETIHGEDKYLALLSGTPIPNKVKDVAVLLKLLFPDEFGRTRSDALVQQIIFGKLIDLRAKLLPYMQLKELRDSVDMPALTEKETAFDLDARTGEVYKILLEEDELEPGEKIRFLQKFLTAPELLGTIPDVENTKAAIISRELTEAFGDHKKIVLFVNHFMERVVRGEESVIDKLDLPDTVEIIKIHGGVSKSERNMIQQRFQQESGKMLLVVSGTTADVGVDFSRAEQVYFYNNPWSKYDKRQQLARSYRPGLDHPLTASTFIAEGTLDRGIAIYIEKKYRAIEKILRGIPITELEKQMVQKGEKAKEGGIDPGIEVNPEFANFFFTAQQRLEKIFARVKQMSQEQFEEFLEKYGVEYADAYRILIHRSYQANGNRITGALVDRFVEERSQTPDTVSILDMASGPEMLGRHISDRLQNRVVSLDMNKHHFPKKDETRVVGSYLKTPFQDKSFDYTTMTFGWDCTEFSPKKGRYARIQALLEMNRLLHIGGRAILNLIYSLELKAPERFHKAIERFGFRVVEKSSGHIQEGEQYRSQVITLEKVADASDLDLVVQQMQEGEDEFSVFKFIREKKQKRGLRGVRNIMTAFTLNAIRIPIRFNTEDAEVLKEEQSILAEGKRLQEQYGGVVHIPRDVVIGHNFVRVYDGRRHILFKELQKGGGVVIMYDPRPEGKEKRSRGKRVRPKTDHGAV